MSTDTQVERASNLLADLLARDKQTLENVGAVPKHKVGESTSPSGQKGTTTEPPAPADPAKSTESRPEELPALTAGTSQRTEINNNDQTVHRVAKGGIVKALQGDTSDA